jgi:hypothetical protein
VSVLWTFLSRAPLRDDFLAFRALSSTGAKNDKNDPRQKSGHGLTKKMALKILQ